MQVHRAGLRSGIWGAVIGGIFTMGQRPARPHSSRPLLLRNASDLAQRRWRSIAA